MIRASRHTHRRSVRFRRAASCAGVAIAWCVGCTQPENRIHVEAHCESGRPRALSEKFDQALYGTDGRGRWEIVLQSRRPAERDPSQTVEQIIYASLFWKPVPGTTYADSSQTNALISYALFSGPTGISYEGAGFVYLKKNRRGGLVGRIESSTLLPTRRIGEPRDLLGSCRVTGDFVAVHDPGRTREYVSAIGQRLGPMPVTPVPPTHAEPR